MSDLSPFKTLSSETKALVIAREFQLRHMPVAQLRAVLAGMARDDEDKQLVLRSVEQNLQAAGHLPEQIAAFLKDLQAPDGAAVEESLQSTRRMRSPFAISFERVTPSDVHSQASGAARAPRRPEEQPARPVTASEPDKVGQAQPKPQGTRLSASGRSVILLADDDKRIRMVFRLRLEDAGFSVLECATGGEAWALIQRGDLALAVLDMKLPGLRGLDILSRLTSTALNLPVVICSACDDLQEEQAVRSYPNLAYLVKPVSPDTLVKTVRELLSA